MLFGFIKLLEETSHQLLILLGIIIAIYANGKVNRTINNQSLTNFNL